MCEIRSLTKSNLKLCHKYLNTIPSSHQNSAEIPVILEAIITSLRDKKTKDETTLLFYPPEHFKCMLFLFFLLPECMQIGSVPGSACHLNQ